MAAILLLFLIRGIVLWIEIVGVGWAVATDLDNYGFAAALGEVVHAPRLGIDTPGAASMDCATAALC